MATKKEIHDKPNVYSWGTKVDFMINSQGGFAEVDDANFSLLWGHDLILTMEPRKIHPQLEDAGAKGYRLIINAADTACEAENLGSKLAYALLDSPLKNDGVFRFPGRIPRCLVELLIARLRRE